MVELIESSGIIGIIILGIVGILLILAVSPTKYGDDDIF